MVVNRRRIVGLKHKWQPQIRTIRMPECFRHHADDRARRSVDHNRAAEHVTARVQRVAPKVVADDYDARGGIESFFCGEIPTLRRRQSEHIEKVRSDLRGRNRLNRRTTVHANDCSAAGPTSNIFENLAAELAEPRDRAIAQIQRRRTRAIFIQGFVDPNELFSARERQWTEKHAFYDGEDGRVRTDAECKRQDSNQSERRRFAELAKSQF
ncbi:MAG: hypothetical protein Udaeo2_29320 [Candidatus Udaeobacter sp.]|nr:MAG: hypothetical protein Udaeo2_29320 [Candidatus Udaeobacter sp.]